MELRVLDSKKRTIQVVPRSEEDLWTLAMYIREGDKVRTVVLRDVAGREARQKERRPIEVTLRVESVEFQPFSGSLRVFGVIEEGPERFGVRGRHQSAYITLNQPIVLIRDEGWGDKVLKKFMESGPRGRAVLVAVDYESAAVAIMTPTGLKIVLEQDLSLGPKDDPARERRLEEALAQLAEASVREASQAGASVIGRASPGQIREVLAEKVRSLAPHLHIITDSVSGGGLEGIHEVVRRDSVLKALREMDSVAAQEVVEEFLRRISTDPSLVAYTLDDVTFAAEAGAVERAVIIDEYLYASDDEQRERFRRLMELIEQKGGRVIIITRDSPAASMIFNMGGVVAILRYRLQRTSG